jgi:hypothetical protein
VHPIKSSVSGATPFGHSRFGAVSIDDAEVHEEDRMTPPARSRHQRREDALHRLEHDVDAWVATADQGGGNPYLIPLSFWWDGRALVVATPASSPTGRNLQDTGKARLGIGHTRDVIIIDGSVQSMVPATDIPDDVADSFAAKTGFDPRRLTTPYLYFHIHPHRLQAWREVNELAGRELMRDGHWLDGTDGRD